MTNLRPCRLKQATYRAFGKRFPSAVDVELQFPGDVPVATQFGMELGCDAVRHGARSDRDPVVVRFGSGVREPYARPHLLRQLIERDFTGDGRPDRLANVRVVGVLLPRTKAALTKFDLTERHLLYLLEDGSPPVRLLATTGERASEELIVVATLDLNHDGRYELVLMIQDYSAPVRTALLEIDRSRANELAAWSCDAAGLRAAGSTMKGCLSTCLGLGAWGGILLVNLVSLAVYLSSDASLRCWLAVLAMATTGAVTIALGRNRRFARALLILSLDPSWDETYEADYRVTAGAYPRPGVFGVLMLLAALLGAVALVM